MSAQKWLEAAERYRIAEEEKLKDQAQAFRKSAAIVRQSSHQAAIDRVRRDEEMGIATKELREFINSDEGKAAMALLAASNRHLIFGETREGGYADVAFIDGSGLQRSYEPHGTWTVYQKPQNLPKPKISLITPLEAIQAAVWYEKKGALEILPWLRGELDKIADAAEPRTAEQRREHTRAACGND